MAQVDLHGQTVTTTSGETRFYPSRYRVVHSTRLTRGHATSPVTAHVRFGRNELANGGERIVLSAEVSDGTDQLETQTWDIPQCEVSTADLTRRIGSGPAIALTCLRSDVIRLIREAAAWADRIAAERLLHSTCPTPGE